MVVGEKGKERELHPINHSVLKSHPSQSSERQARGCLCPDSRLHCWLLAFYKRDNLQSWVTGQRTKWGSNLQVITESPRNDFQNTEMSFVCSLLVVKQQ